MTAENDMEVGLIHAQTGELLMLNKKERILVKEILGKTLSSKEAKEVIRKLLGKEYIEIGYRLLEDLGGSKIS
jgi:hypothetical protein